MTDLSSLQQKIAALKAVAQVNAITPTYLGAVFDTLVDCLALMPSNTDLSDALTRKVDKVAGKGLSTEDFTTALAKQLKTLLPVYRFDRVLFNEGETGPEEIPDLAEGALVLFLNEDYAPDKVRVCADHWEEWVDLPRPALLGSREPAWRPDGVRVRAWSRPPTDDGMLSESWFKLCPNSLFVVGGLETVNSRIKPEADYCAIYYVDSTGRMQLLSDTKAGPMPQATSEGDESQYVYSVADADDARCVMTMRDTTIIQQDGQLMFRRGFWSAASEPVKYQATRIPVATTRADGAMSKTDRQQLNASIATIGGHLVVGGVMNLGHFSSLAGALTEAARSEVSGARDVAVMRFTYSGMAGTVASFIFQTIKGDDISIQYIFDRGTVTVRSVTGATGGDSGVNPVNVETTWVHRLRWNGNSIEAVGYEPYGGTAPVLASVSGVAKTSQLPTAATSTKSGLMTAAQFNKLNEMAEDIETLKEAVAELQRNGKLII